MTGVIEFDAVIPVGARSSADLPSKTGQIQNTWLDSDVPEYVIELADLIAGRLEPQLTRQQHLDALGVLSSLKGRAALGRLPIENASTSPAKVMQRLSYLIELRPRLTGGQRPPRLFRLYYAEPANIEAALLPLVLSTKPNSGDPNNEQNASIDDAKIRSRVWTLRKAMEERNGTGD